MEPASTSSAAASEHVCTGGEPVDLATGAVVDSATDLEIPGLIPLVFKRYYSSLRHDDTASSMGPGWACALVRSAHRPRRAMHRAPRRGRPLHPFRKGRGRPESSFHRRERMTLTRTGELEFRVYAHDLRRASVFAPVRRDGDAVLQRIEDNYGNAIVFEYRSERLARVIDTAGRVVNVAWRGSLIASLSVGGAGVASSSATTMRAKRLPCGGAERDRAHREVSLRQASPLGRDDEGPGDRVCVRVRRGVAAVRVQLRTGGALRGASRTRRGEARHRGGWRRAARRHVERAGAGRAADAPGRHGAGRGRVRRGRPGYRQGERRR